jgi:hypothetical protein
MLGTVLWTAYSAAYTVIEPNLHNKPLLSAAVSGGIAGGIQALVAAPVENIRLVVEGGAAGQSWLQAWKYMMDDSSRVSRQARRAQLKEARAFRKWMLDVHDLAGRGWHGWGWGFAKDVCGEWNLFLVSTSSRNTFQAFSTFFTIFEVTRRSGQAARVHSENLMSKFDESGSRFASMKRHTPRILNSVILVTGGVSSGDFFC